MHEDEWEIDSKHTPETRAVLQAGLLGHECVRAYPITESFLREVELDHGGFLFFTSYTSILFYFYK